MPALVDELQSTVQHVRDTAGRSVVRVGRGQGRGAGVVISPGHVLTNAHNLRGNEITVTLPGADTGVVGTVVGVDSDGDLAVVAVQTGDTPPIAWEPTDLNVGTPVFAVANVRVTFGLVSAVAQTFRGPGGRRISGSIEHTAPLTRGSSGGPIVDATGRLVGINTHRVGDGFYMAIPATAELKGRIDALARGESPRRLRLGVAIAPAHAARRMRAAVGLPERDGLLVRGVESGSPAEGAGIKQGDLLVSAGGRELRSHDDLFEAFDAAGTTLPVKVVRGTEELELTVSFGE